MKPIRTASKSSLFLMELILAILFFSVASAVCVQLFTRAHLTSVRSGDLNRAVLCAESAASSFKAADNLEELAGLTGALPQSGGELSVFYGPDWTPAADARDAVYRMDLIAERDGGLSIEVYRLSGDGITSLFQLEAAK